MPAVRVFVFPLLLDPFKGLEERFEFNLAVCQADFLETFFTALSTTLGLEKREKETD